MANPMGTDGFEFVEYTAPDPTAAARPVRAAGFPGGRPASQQERHAAFAGRHQFRHQCRAGILRPAVRAGARAVGVRHGVSRAAMPPPRSSAPCRSAPSRIAAASGPMELNIPAIVGIGGSLIYFVDRYGDRSIYDVDFKPVHAAAAGARRAAADRPSHAQRASRPHGQVDRLLRDAVQFPRDPLLRHRRQEDRAVLARARPVPAARSASRSTSRRTTSRRSRNTCANIAARASSTSRCPPTTSIAPSTCCAAAASPSRTRPETYYEGIDARVAGHGEDIEELRRRRILIDGSGATDEGVLLQIFTANVIGPIFFEIIQRKGNQGFGEGNFKALFESIELDQIRRGVI